MAKNQGKVAQNKSAVVSDLPRACADEASAVEFLEKRRWPQGAACPACGSGDAYQMRDRKTGERSKRFLWKCNGCSRQFTVRVGTVFEDSRIPLRHWCYAFWAACASKKGVSAMQIRRMTGLSYKSALFLMHRIRFAMADNYANPPMLDGTVEVDETYVGGKVHRRGTSHLGRGTPKAPVVALVQRGGNLRALHVEKVTAATLRSAIREHISPTATLMTDEYAAYRGLGNYFKGGHFTVKHSDKEYVRGDAHVNTAESFFSLLKRGVFGTFHSVSKKHFHRYCSEFEFRWNARKIDDGARTALVIRKAVGKRLRYREPSKPAPTPGNVTS